MKKTFRKFTAAATLAAIISAGAAFATEAEQSNIGTIAPLITSYETINDVTMLPLRSVAEHFGYTVEWFDETRSVSLTKGAHYITFSIDEDSYAFSRTAPQPLGQAPILFNDTTTYVPESFFTELIGLNSEITDGGIEISMPNIVTVKEIAEDGALLVADEIYGEVLVLVSEDTEITANGAEASKDLIEVGQALDVKYSEHMTRSLPPQTVAISIDILNLAVDAEEFENTELSPVLTTISAIGEDGAITVGEGENEVIIYVTKETVITKDGEAASASELTVGTEISVLYADYMTMSIPPQTSAVSIEIVK